MLNWQTYSDNNKLTIFTALYSSLLIFCTYFCLWAISDYLLNNAILALLFLPMALRQSIILHLAKKYWISVYLAEWCCLYIIQIELKSSQINLIYTLSLISIIGNLFFIRYYQGKIYRIFLLQFWFVLGQSIINLIVFWHTTYSLFFILIISIAGNSLLLPIIYLLKMYLVERYWIPLTVNAIHNAIEFRVLYVVLYLFIYLLNIYMQLHLPEEFYRFTLFCLAIPVILLAFRYGLQGALFGTILNNIALIITAYHFSDLLLSIIMQTLMGVLLGLAIQYLQDLNLNLSQQLIINQQLSQQLINKEENIRKDIARELHDEIGQNITAIRTQALILKRLEQNEKIKNSANTIERLSLNIYDTTQNLLNRIRPKMLDDLDLKQALQQLFWELDFQSHHISAEIEWKNSEHIQLSHLLEITLYRLCQESLNNIVKYANATKVKVMLSITEHICLIIQDNGNGFNQNQKMNGFGLKGMQERVQILGGEFRLNSSTNGTTIYITLPYLK